MVHKRFEALNNYPKTRPSKGDHQAGAIITMGQRGDAMDQYNRDGPQKAEPTWMGVLFSTVAGFLLGGTLFPFAAYVLYMNGPCHPYITLLAVVATPPSALLGGLLGAWFNWKCPNHQPF